MRASNLRLYSGYYWVHGEVMEYVQYVPFEDGTEGFVKRNGEYADVRSEDDIVPLSESFYNRR